MTEMKTIDDLIAQLKINQGRKCSYTVEYLGIDDDKIAYLRQNEEWDIFELVINHCKELKKNMEDDNDKLQTNQGDNQ